MREGKHEHSVGKGDKGPQLGRSREISNTEAFAWDTLRPKQWSFALPGLKDQESWAKGTTSDFFYLESQRSSSGKICGSQLQQAPEPPGKLVKTQIAWHRSWSFRFSRSCLGPKNSPNKFQGNANDAGLGNALWELLGSMKNEFKYKGDLLKLQIISSFTWPLV